MFKFLAKLFSGSPCKTQAPRPRWVFIHRLYTPTETVETMIPGAFVRHVGGKQMLAWHAFRINRRRDLWRWMRSEN